MSTLFAAVGRSALDSLGVPASLRAFLAATPGAIVGRLAEPEKTAGASSAVQWHTWKDVRHRSFGRVSPGYLPGWRYAGGRYGQADICCEEMVRLCRTDVVEAWSCDISDVACVGASKSPLQDFPDLDALVTEMSPEMITPVTESKLQENLAWDEIRILHRNLTGDHFVRHEWDGRVCLMNAGGSHHFAAARYLAAKLGVKVPLCGTLKVHRLDESAVAGLYKKYALFVMADGDDAGMAFHEEMRRFRAGYLRARLPNPYSRGHVVMLRRDEARAASVGEALNRSGAVDLGEYLLALAARQPRESVVFRSTPTG